jgi:hypothetical protein
VGDKTGLEYRTVETWQAIEAGEPFHHHSEVTGVTAAEAAQVFADLLLSQRLGNRSIIEKEIRVRALGERKWQKFTVRLVALVEPKRNPGCCHPEVSDGR